MRKRKVERQGHVREPEASAQRPFSHRPGPYDDGLDGARTLSITPSDIAGKAQIIVSRAATLMGRQRAGKLSVEMERLLRETGELLENERNDLSSIRIAKGSQVMSAYEALILTRAEILSHKDAGCTGGC